VDKRKVVVGASCCVLLAGCAHTAATPITTTTTPPLGQGTVTSCTRDHDGYVVVGGTVENLRNAPGRVEITVGVFDALTGKQVDYTQAKSSVLGTGQQESYKASVYDVGTGESSVPKNITFKCRVTAIRVMDPNEVG
jgi:hypothetical protein